MLGLTTCQKLKLINKQAQDPSGGGQTITEKEP